MTGSNSVNVFLGLGTPWILASIVHYMRGTTYNYPGGDLGFSVVIFTICALSCIFLLAIRRNYCGGELGGGRTTKIASSIFLCCLWVFYITMSTMKTYDVI